MEEENVGWTTEPRLHYLLLSLDLTLKSFNFGDATIFPCLIQVILFNAQLNWAHLVDILVGDFFFAIRIYR